MCVYVCVCVPCTPHPAKRVDSFGSTAATSGGGGGGGSGCASSASGSRTSRASTSVCAEQWRGLKCTYGKSFYLTMKKPG